MFFSLSLPYEICVTSVPRKLETAEGGQVLGLLAGHAPVVGLVDGLVVLPGRLVVDGQPLHRLGGQCLRREVVTS